MCNCINDITGDSVTNISNWSPVFKSVNGAQFLNAEPVGDPFGEGPYLAQKQLFSIVRTYGESKSGERVTIDKKIKHKFCPLCGKLLKV